MNLLTCRRAQRACVLFCALMGLGGWPAAWAGGSGRAGGAGDGGDAAAAPVSVEAGAVSVQTRYFDPQSPPKQMPPLKAGEAAVTTSDFSVQSRMNVTILKQQSSGGRCSATVRVDSVTVTTGLRITLWLPRGTSAKLRAHEEGHRRISERFYHEAADVARRLAEPRVGQRLRGAGEDCRKAAQAAMSQSMNQLNDQWMNQISAAAQAVQERYDALTDHGRNDLEEAQAIERAMKG